MKKLVAYLLCFAVLFAFAACGSAKPAETSAPTQETAAPTPIGSVIAFLGSTGFELVYDEEGNALEVKGLNTAGEEIAAQCQKYAGRACVHGIRGILRYASDNSLIGDAKTFSIRIRHGDVMPEETFLETIITDTQYLADEECTGVRMVLLDESRLTPEGLVDPETALFMASLYLQADVNSLTDEGIDENNRYRFSSEGTVCLVDGVTGCVSG